MIPAGFTQPFRLDPMEIYILDANGFTAGDITAGFPRPRGWGRIQYLPDGDTEMTKWKQWFYAAQGRAKNTSITALIDAMNEPEVPDAQVQ
jgi:hypothetical protein